MVLASLISSAVPSNVSVVMHPDDGDLLLPRVLPPQAWVGSEQTTPFRRRTHKTSQSRAGRPFGEFTALLLELEKQRRELTERAAGPAL